MHRFCRAGNSLLYINHKHMKQITLLVALFSMATLGACNTNGNSPGQNKKNGSVPTVPLSQPVAPADTSLKTTVPIKEILDGYLQLKNAFAKDNTNDAATIATALQTTLINFNKTALTAQQKKTFEDIADDAKEHAEHIGKNGGNIAHQREHFEMLSKDMYDMVKAFGAGQVLYKDFCPMYNKGKGAFWVSETKEIKNPYLGKAMPTCGTVKEEIK